MPCENRVDLEHVPVSFCCLQCTYHNVVLYLLIIDVQNELIQSLDIDPPPPCPKCICAVSVNPLPQ